jgi:hypothetical protein
MSLNHIVDINNPAKLDLYAKTINSNYFTSSKDVIFPTGAPLILQGSFPEGFATAISSVKLQREEKLLYNQDTLDGTYKKVLKIRGACFVNIALAPLDVACGFTLTLTDIPSEFFNSTVEYYSGIVRTGDGFTRTVDLGGYVCTTNILGQITFSFTASTHLDVVVGNQKVVFDIDLMAV